MRCFRSTLGGSHLARIWLAVATCAPSVFHGTLTADHHLAAGLLHQPLLRVPSRTDDETDEVHFRVLFAGHEDFFLRTRGGVRHAAIPERAASGGRAHLELLRGDELLRRPVQRVEFLWSASGPVSAWPKADGGRAEREQRTWYFSMIPLRSPSSLPRVRFSRVLVRLPSESYSGAGDGDLTAAAPS